MEMGAVTVTSKLLEYSDLRSLSSREILTVSFPLESPLTIREMEFVVLELESQLAEIILLSELTL